MARFKDMLRVVARITISNGTGRGAALGVVRLRPTPDNAAPWRDALQEKLTPGTREGIISMHLLESEPELSGATADIPAVRNEGARDWFVLIDGTHVGAVSAVIASQRVRAKRGPMTGSAKQSSFRCNNLLDCFVATLLAMTAITSEVIAETTVA